MTTHREEFLSQCACVDFETTHLDHNQAEIIEQGISIYDDGYWQVACSRLHDCEAPDIPPEASAVNNITKEMLSGYKPFSLKNFGILELNPHRNIMVSHNATFDSHVLEKYVDPETFEALSNNWLCSYRMIKFLHVNEPEFASLSLSYLRYKLKFDVRVQTEPHRAGYDSYINGLLLEYIIDVMEEREVLDVNKPYFSQIKQLLAIPIELEYMPNVGKHAGKKIEDLPLDYMQWMMKKMDRCQEDDPNYDIDLATTIAANLERYF